MCLHNVEKLTSKVIFSSNHEFSFSIFFSSQLTTPTVDTKKPGNHTSRSTNPGCSSPVSFLYGVWKVSVLLPGLLLKKKQVSLLYSCSFQWWARWTRWLQFHSWEQDLLKKTGEGRTWDPRPWKQSHPQARTSHYPLDVYGTEKNTWIPPEPNPLFSSLSFSYYSHILWTMYQIQ